MLVFIVKLIFEREENLLCRSVCYSCEFRLVGLIRLFIQGLHLNGAINQTHTLLSGFVQSVVLSITDIKLKREIHL